MIRPAGWLRIASTAGLLCGVPLPAFAQVSAGVEYARDRFTYHFENPSAIDTPQPVPHFFEQRYVADDTWLTARWRIAAAGLAFTTEGGFALPRSIAATDYDTFFDPDGSVIVSGTRGPASMSAFRVAERVQIARVRAVELSVGYRLRVDRFDFGAGYKTVTRDGVLVDASIVTTREMTRSIVQEPFVGMTVASRSGARWQLALDGELAPFSAGRLDVQLPDKYPGQDLVFTAKGLGAHAHAAAIRTVGGKWKIAATFDAAAIGGYQSSASLTRRIVAAGVSVSR